MNGTLALTHLAVFLFGVATWLPFTIWEGRKITHQGDPVTAHSAKPKTPRSYDRTTRRRAAGTILLVSAIILGLGFQQVQYQRTSNAQVTLGKARDACYETWGREVVQTLRTRIKETSKVEKAQKVRDKAGERRDDAVDDVLLLVLALRKEDPPPAQAVAEAKFRAALERFSVARDELEVASAALVVAQREAASVRVMNPYPVLNCNTPDKTGEPVKEPAK